MPAAERRITVADIQPLQVFAAERKARRAALLGAKRLRRVALGPWCTVHFESFETMLFQVQEMLLIEKGGEEQLADELAAYNPMIPQGAELTATVMFEIDDPVRRARALAELGGVEDRFFLEINGDRAAGAQEGDVERTRADGKTSSVHFLHFPLTPEQIAGFRRAGARVLVGCDHPSYAHLAILSDETRAELAKDLAYAGFLQQNQWARPRGMGAGPVTVARLRAPTWSLERSAQRVRSARTSTARAR